MIHQFDLQQKDSYVSIQNMIPGQIAVTKHGKALVMRINGDRFVVLAGGSLSGDTYGLDAIISVRILSPGSVVTITVEG